MDTDEMEQELRARKAARARKKLITAIVTCLVVAVAVVLVIVLIVVPRTRGTATQDAASATSTAALDTSQVKDQGLAQDTTPVTTVPNMAGLFGQTLDAVVTVIPSAVQVSLAATTDETIPAATQLADYGIYQTGADGTQTKVADIYLYLDANNVIIGSYYVVSLENIGYTSNATDFAGLLGDSAFIQSLLSASGTGVTDFVPQVPADKTAYETTTTNAAGATIVAKDEYSYSGNTALATAPLTWKITFAYDYGTSNITGNIEDASYTVAISLS